MTLRRPPLEVVPTAPPATTILIDSQFYADYSGAITYPSLLLSGATAFGVTYRLWEAEQFRFAGCPIDCDNRKNWVVGNPDTTTHDGGNYSASASDDQRLQTAYQVSQGGHPAVLRYAWCIALCQQSSNWSSTNVDTAGSTGFFISLAARLGQTHIAYVTPVETAGQTSRLRYARCSTNCATMNSWTTATVDTSVYGETQIAVDPAGVVHVVYAIQNVGGPRLKYARCAGACEVATNWQIDTIGPGRLPSLAVDGVANLVLAFVDDAGPIRIATCAAGCATGSWNQSLVAVPEHTPRDVSLVEQPSGEAHLGYMTDVTTEGGLDFGVVRLGHCSLNCSIAASWQFLTVDSTRYYHPDFLSVALDSAGHVAIAHADSYVLRFTITK